MRRTPARRIPVRQGQRTRRRRSLSLIVGAILVAVGAAYYASPPHPTRSGPPVVAAGPFERTRAQAQQFMDAYRTITLSESQEAVRVEALSAIPARCCGDYSAATCCCACNLSRTIWGLAKTMIVGGAGATEVRDAAQTWTATLNPAGYAGDACFTGGCARPLRTDGCGGMDAGELLF